MIESLLYVLASIVVALIATSLVDSLMKYDSSNPLIKNIDFGIGEYWKVGKISYLSIFKIKIYKKVGEVKSVLGIIIGKNKHD